MSWRVDGIAVESSASTGWRVTQLWPRSHCPMAQPAIPPSHFAHRSGGAVFRSRSLMRASMSDSLLGAVLVRRSSRGSSARASNM